MKSVSIRPAHPDEAAELEALQWRASLANPADREALLQHPDAISLSPEQIADGLVWVAEHSNQRLGFASILPRDDGEFDLDALFVEPNAWGSKAILLRRRFCAAWGH